MASPGARIRVRPARRDDIPAIVAVSVSSASEKEEVGFGRPRSEQTFADVGRLTAAWRDPNLVRGEEVLLAELDGRVVGCVTLEDRGESLELVNIDVLRELQGQGIGMQIVRFVEERARQQGKPAVTLGTSRNAAGVPWKSLPWWQHLGYRITHEEENDWTRAIGPGAREIRMRKPVFPSGSVQLRDVIEDDLPIFFRQQQDPEAVRMAAFVARDPSDREVFMAHWHRILHDGTVINKTVVWDGKVAGNIGRFLDREFGKPEVTYWIGREYWGRGIATEALRVFLEENAERPVFARAADDNRASIRVMEKCGFRFVGRSKGFAHARGQEIDEVIFELDDGPGKR